MQAILQKQIPNSSVGASTLSDSSKKIEDLQRAQAKDNDQIIKSLTDQNGTGLNSNVIKLFKEVNAVSNSLNKQSRALNGDEAGKITDAATGRRQFNTLKPRVDSFKEGAKDFFTMRGFLDKTGIVKRGSGGLLSEYLDKGEAKKKYVDQRMKTKGTTFGSRETFAKQFDAQQDTQYEINKNEKEIKELRDNGATDIGLKRSGLLNKRESLATALAKVDPSVRPEGFDARTGKIKEAAPETATEQQQKAKSAGKVIPFSSAATAAAGEESMLEQNRMVAEQSELLKKIEENTRSLKGGTQGDGTTQKAQEAAGGLGLMDMLGGNKLGKIAKTAGRGLLNGAKALGRFGLAKAGPLAAVAAVGAGAYEGYKGWNAAGDKEEQANKDIDAKVASGEINQEQAAALKKETGETATVEKGGAAGKGTGMAIGGAAGALKGAAVGAAIGSVVPVVGTVIGGAIGATVGAIGGSWAGGKAGGWLGKQAGKATNFVKSFFGGSEDEVNAREAKSTGASTSIQFSEMQFAQKDPDNYAKFSEYRDKLVQEYADKQAKKFKHESPTQGDFKVAKMMADKDAIVKFKSEIEAVGAGKVSGGEKQLGETTKEAVKGAAAGLAPAGGMSGEDGRLMSKNSAAINTAALNSYSDGRPRDAKITPFSSPNTGNVVDKQSSDNEQAKLDASKGGGTANIVSAPTVNNNNTTQTNNVKLSPRNNDSTVNKYLSSRYAM
jgi:hypothetical protein